MVLSRHVVQSEEDSDGRTTNPLRRRGRLRENDGKVEPACGGNLPGLARATLGLRWIDVGCGNGAFTELLVERCAPATVHGIDPSEAQLAFARTRPAARVAQFRQGDAMVQ